MPPLVQSVLSRKSFGASDSMGNKSAKPKLTQDTVNFLVSQTHFDEEMIEVNPMQCIVMSLSDVNMS